MGNPSIRILPSQVRKYFALPRGFNAAVCKTVSPGIRNYTVPPYA